VGKQSTFTRNRSVTFGTAEGMRKGRDLIKCHLEKTLTGTNDLTFSGWGRKGYEKSRKRKNLITIPRGKEDYSTQIEKRQVSPFTSTKKCFREEGTALNYVRHLKPRIFYPRKKKKLSTTEKGKEQKHRTTQGEKGEKWYGGGGVGGLAATL